MIGPKLAHYEIKTHLGSGGMGDVYRAKDTKLGRDVAIKMLPQAFATDPERLARLQREARTLASLNHPNIASIYGLEEFGGTTSLVLELVDGDTLGGPLPVAKALDYCRQVAEALEAAHAKGIIHRDLKPANIKVTQQGRVKVLDFGLAKAVWGSNGQDLSSLPTAIGRESITGQIAGTPPYMSPEQARGQAVDHRTDIWAFGCLLYELLTGVRAFRGESSAETIGAVLEYDPDWKALPAGTPAKIRTLLRLCLEKDAAKRLQNIRAARDVIAKVQHGWSGWKIAAIATATLAILAVGALGYLRAPVRVVERSEWTQLTHFPDSVGQPALSSDGRMLAFIRGPSTFYTSGQIYVKILPDGSPRQLTHDELHKMSPVFSPDGSQIAYTTVDGQFQWDTWRVPVLGGEPQRWLPNASGLVWMEKGRLLFSEIKQATHMAIVTAEESRVGERNVYLPAHERGMGHRSYPSPDNKWALVVEMDQVGGWIPCRLVPIDGSSPGHQVGPAGAGCTFAAWSHDGKWMYLTSNAGGAYHTWRQRFPDGKPEQLTAGPTEEEGIALTADGRFFVTAVGVKQRSVTLHDANGERQVSLEGYAYNPVLARDGKKMTYEILKGTSTYIDPSELWIADLDSARNEPALPGLMIAGGQFRNYDFSQDGKRIVAAVRDRDGKYHVWLAELDRRVPPRQIPNIEGQEPRFGLGGIFFRGVEGNTAFLFRVAEDGTGLRKVISEPVIDFENISPDGQFSVAIVSIPGETVQATVAFPLDGGSPIRILNRPERVQWSHDMRFLYVAAQRAAGTAQSVGRTYIVPIAPGYVLPRVPREGLTEEQMTRQHGVRVIDAADVAPGPTPDAYAFSRETTQRNLYRIPIP